MSDIGLFLLMFAGLLLMLGVIRFLAWLTELQEKHGSLARAGINTVKKYVDVRPSVMSQSEKSAAPSIPSSLQTSHRQTTDQTTDPAARRQKLLDTYAPLRELGMKREDARAFLKPWNIPLDNNLWADAAPPDDPHITPVAGRPTDAEFPFQPLA